MKKGKSVKLNLSKLFKTTYGTVDSKNLKSIYINVQSWVSPKEDYENYNRIVCNLSREIKHSVYEALNRNIFKENSIVDLDLRTSGINFGKKSFFNLEINLYLITPTDFKSVVLKDSIKEIVKTIYKNNMKNNHYFTFSLSKKEMIK